MEKNLDFDRVIDRKGTRCLKYDFAVKRGYPADILSMWVADMDFRTSSYIEDALASVVSHNIYGYTDIQHGDGYFEAVSGWMKRHHNWDVEERWHLITPGVCFAIATAVRGLTSPGEAVIIQDPVYYPFRNIIVQNGRKAVSSDLKYDPDTGRYEMDYDDFEKKVIENDIKLFILCNPHNPVGRVWTKDELKRIGDICKKHGVIVFSDEIHFDFIWDENDHYIFQEIDPSYRDFTITATAPSKTFNLAGLQLSNIFAANDDVRKKFYKALQKTGYDEPNVMGLTACEAAYRDGDEWYEAVCSYIKSNIEYTKTFVRENLPKIKMTEPEGTYLVWLDMNGTGYSDSEIDDLIINKAKLWLDSGKIFGKTGQGFQRINVACPRATLDEALSRIKYFF